MVSPLEAVRIALLEWLDAHPVGTPLPEQRESIARVTDDALGHLLALGWTGKWFVFRITTADRMVARGFSIQEAQLSRLPLLPLIYNECLRNLNDQRRPT